MFLPQAQQQIDGYQVKNVKLTTDPLVQKSLEETLGVGGRPPSITKTSVFEYASKHFKRVFYTPTKTATASVCTKQQTTNESVVLTNTKKEATTTALQQQGMPQIPTDGMAMALDPEAEIGPCTQTQPGEFTQQHCSKQVVLLPPAIDKDESNDNNIDPSTRDSDTLGIPTPGVPERAELTTAEDVSRATQTNIYCLDRSDGTHAVAMGDAAPDAIVIDDDFIDGYKNTKKINPM